MKIEGYNNFIQPDRIDDPGRSKQDPRIDALGAAGGLSRDQDEKLRAVCQDFEAFFLYQLMKEMHNTVNESEFMHGGRAEEIFRDMMYDEMSRKMAKVNGGPLGIANMLYQQLTRPLAK